MKSLNHGIVQAVNERGIFYSLPQTYGTAVLGPALTAVAGLVVGERVLVGLIGESISDPIVISRLAQPQPTEMYVHAVDGVWPARPTDSATVTVFWIGAAPFPPVVTEGVDGMLGGVDVPLTAAV